MTVSLIFYVQRSAKQGNKRAGHMSGTEKKVERLQAADFITAQRKI
ncbi:hypothetical protein [Pseudomonas sp. SWRI154]|nr:hypothetical protein [Pseudomonas sp. SWRI154]MBC3361991.1 hypothetical protein [Pseudomonas sp. SWRI154]